MATPEAPAGRVGTDAGGYRLFATIKELRLEAWGYWTPEVVATFRRQIGAAIRRLGEQGLFVVDAKELKPQGTDAQDALREFLRVLSAVAFASGKITAQNALTRMQLTRLVREGGLDERVTFDG
jgi:hypothetical protein